MKGGALRPAHFNFRTAMTTAPKAVASNETTPGAPRAPKVKLASLRANSEKERAGDWIESTSIPGVTFMVRSINYPPYTIARDQLLQRLRRKAGSNKPLAQDTLTTELGRLYAQHLLLGWKGFDVEYSPETAMEHLTNPEFREMVAAIENAANQVGAAELEFIESTAKN